MLRWQKGNLDSDGGSEKKQRREMQQANERKKRKKEGVSENGRESRRGGRNEIGSS